MPGECAAVKNDDHGFFRAMVFCFFNSLAKTLYKQIEFLLRPCQANNRQGDVFAETERCRMLNIYDERPEFLKLGCAVSGINIAYCIVKWLGVFMSFTGNILKQESYDPYYKAEFTYEEDGIVIKKGFAEIVRKYPKLEITYDEDTQRILGEYDCKKLELELANLVLGYFIQGKEIKNLLAERKNSQPPASKKG